MRFVFYYPIASPSVLLIAQARSCPALQSYLFPLRIRVTSPTLRLTWPIVNKNIYSSVSSWTSLPSVHAFPRLLMSATMMPPVFCLTICMLAQCISLCHVLFSFPLPANTLSRMSLSQPAHAYQCLSLQAESFVLLFRLAHSSAFLFSLLSLVYILLSVITKSMLITSEFLSTHVDFTSSHTSALHPANQCLLPPFPSSSTETDLSDMHYATFPTICHEAFYFIFFLSLREG